MEISPASVVAVNDAGQYVEIEDDVLNVARDLRELGQQHGVDLRLRYSERQDFWVVYQRERHPITNEITRDQLVTTCRGELNPQLVQRVRKVMDPSYDLAAEVEKLEAQRKREHKHEQRERMGEAAERLAHAMRKDTHRNQRRIFVPGGLPA